MYQILLVIFIATLGLLSHRATKSRQLEYILRTFIVIIALIDAWQSLITNSTESRLIYALTSLISLALLFLPVRKSIAKVLTLIQLCVTGQILLPLIRKKLKASDYIQQNQIFSAYSIPHFVALFIYINAIAVLLTKPVFSIVINLPELFDSFTLQKTLSYSGIFFIAISLLGIGLFINRSFKECLPRLSLSTPKNWQIILALLLVFASFAYDAYWMLYTHSTHRCDDLTMRLSYYNAATFTLVGGYFTSIVLALIISTFSAAGEEILFRGALQPVFGILPSAFLQSVMLSQRHLAPLPVLQMLIWCTFMGLVKRYTNTSTTIITHVLINIITILLYVVNP